MARAQYEHTQVGWPMRVAFVAGSLLLLGVALVPEMQAARAPIALLLAGCAALLVLGWLWSSLTVRIDSAALQFRFGPGVPRKSVPLADIASVEVTRTRFWEGWGIHRTCRGWLYNVSGFDAVLVRRMDGRSFMLGTDEPRRLKAALERAMADARRR